MNLAPGSAVAIRTGRQEPSQSNIGPIVIADGSRCAQKNSLLLRNEALRGSSSFLKTDLQRPPKPLARQSYQLLGQSINDAKRQWPRRPLTGLVSQHRRTNTDIRTSGAPENPFGGSIQAASCFIDGTSSAQPLTKGEAAPSNKGVTDSIQKFQAEIEELSKQVQQEQKVKQQLASTKRVTQGGEADRLVQEEVAAQPAPKVERVRLEVKSPPGRDDRPSQADKANTEFLNQYYTEQQKSSAYKTDNYFPQARGLQGQRRLQSALHSRQRGSKMKLKVAGRSSQPPTRKRGTAADFKQFRLISQSPAGAPVAADTAVISLNSRHFSLKAPNR